MPIEHDNSVKKVDGVTISGTPSTGQVITATSSTAANWQTPSGGGGGSIPDFSGSGSPETVQTATVGKTYQDTTNGGLYFKGSGSGNTGWVAMGADIPGSSGSVNNAPMGVVYEATTSGDINIVAGSPNGVVAFTDQTAYSSSGTGNALAFRGNGSDGNQDVIIFLGSSGQFVWDFKADGRTELPRQSGDSFPRIVADPSGVIYFGNGTSDPVSTGGNVSSDGGGDLIVESGGAGALSLTSAGSGNSEWLANGTITLNPGSGLPVVIEGVSVFTYTGDPNGHVSPNATGDLCIDTSTPALYQATTGATPAWSLIGGGGGGATFTGSGNPEGVHTGSVGQTYEDTTHGGLYYKVSGTATNTGWVAMGASIPGSSSGLNNLPLGVVTDPSFSGYVQVLCGPNGDFVITDTAAQAVGGTENNFIYFAGAADGDQSISINLGSSDQFSWAFNADGTTQFPAAIDTGNSQTSGSLSTVSLTSGTGAQVDTTHDRTLCVPTSTAGSVVVALSPDDTTYTTLYTKTTLASDEVTVRVPARWYVKVTATTSTLSTAHFY